MDWLRRNWPDLLIGIALVAVIAGIIATLITGGSFFPVGQSTRTSTPPAQSTTTQSSASPSAPSSTTSPSTSSSTSSNNGSSSASSSSTQTASGGSTNGTAGSGTAPANGSAATGGATSAAPSGNSSGGVAVLPPSDNGSSASSGGTSSGASSGAAPSAPSTSSTASAAPPASSSAAASASPSTAAGNGPGAAAPYRISVGAFSHADYAQRQEQVFKNAGYPVFLADQGDLTIVLVGPYRSQSEADAVAAKIKSGGFGVDPVVYQFKGTRDSAPQPASPSAGGSATPSAASSSSAASTTTSSSSATAGDQRYLQVGAYGSAQSAKPQRDKLASMGYQVTERTEGGLVKVLIGPFGADRLQQVQSDLKAAGIDSFPR